MLIVFQGRIGTWFASRSRSSGPRLCHFGSGHSNPMFSKRYSLGWNSVLSFEPPDPIQASSKVSAVFQAAQDSGFVGSITRDVILSGHSLGGIVARSLAETDPFEALILFGSYLALEGDDSLINHDGNRFFCCIHVP